MKTARKSKLRAVLVVLLLLTVASIPFVLFLTSLNKVSPAPAVTQEVPAAPVVPEKKEVVVQLPNADPVAALKENYDADSSLWHVVSKDFPLADAHYRPTNVQLAAVASRTDKSADERSLRADVMPDLEKMFADAQAAGHDLLIGSGFRSYEQQNIYFSNYSRINGEAEANKYSARPGQSEHQTGLSLDISTVSRACYLEECFAQTPAGMWLAEHSTEYGFILRYPVDKVEITKYIFEPWHFRYVGKDFAKAIKQSGLTLDEARPYLQTALAELKQAGEVQ